MITLAIVAEQNPSPNHRVEDDVVLAREVVAARLRVDPPLLPCVRIAAALGPLHRRREVADNSVEPHVETLHRLIPPAVQWYRHTPVKITSDRSRPQIFQQILTEPQHVRPPAGT